MPALNRRETTEKWPSSAAYRRSVQLDEQGQYWIHWSYKRKVHLPLGPHGCRGRNQLRYFHYRRRVQPAEARLTATEWGSRFPELPRRLQSWC